MTDNGNGPVGGLLNRIKDQNKVASPSPPSPAPPSPAPMAPSPAPTPQAIPQTDTVGVAYPGEQGQEPVAVAPAPPTPEVVQPVASPPPVQAPAAPAQNKMMNKPDIESKMSSLWDITPGAMTEAKDYGRKIGMTHGMMAAVPLLCKGDDCPFLDVCSISPTNRTPGGRCPMEAAALVTRFQEYCDHFELNMSNPTPGETIDMATVNDIVEIEVQLLRANNRIAINGNFITRTIGSVDQKGRVFYEDALDPAIQYIDKLKERRQKLYKALNATRKDRERGQTDMDPSSKAASIFKKVSEAMAGLDASQMNIVNASYEVVEEPTKESEV